MTQTAEIFTPENTILPEGTKVMCFMDFGPDRKLTRRVHEYYEISYGIEMTANGKGGFTFPDGSLMPEIGFYYNAKRNEIEIDSGLSYDRGVKAYFQKHGKNICLNAGEASSQKATDKGEH